MRLKTEEDIQRLIDDRIPENYTLDYKEEPWPEKKGKNTANEIAKDISSFANNQGGIIIVGVKEDKRTKLPVARTPFEIGDWEERIDDVHDTSIKPFIEGLRIRRIISDEQKGKGYLIIEIPESPNAPHMVATTNKYYRRTNSGAQPMSEAEVAELYNRRQEQEKRLKELYKPLFDKLEEEKDETQLYCLFLPRIFHKELIDIYRSEFISNTESGLKRLELGISGMYTPDVKDGFFHYRHESTSNYHRLPNVWIHQDGGLLFVSKLF